MSWQPVAASAYPHSCVCRWIDDVFLPAVNAAGNQGWDMVRVATDIKEKAEAQGHQVGMEAWKVTEDTCTAPASTPCGLL